MLHKLGLAKASQINQGPVTLAHLLPSACIDLDATIADSYGGAGQVWKNLVASPADGSPSASYNFYRGATAAAHTDDPGFAGPAGEAGAHWLFDGGDAFKQTTTTPLLSNLHKAGGGSFTMIAAFHHQLSSAEQRLFSTQSNGASTQGISFAISGVKKLLLRQAGDSGTAVASVVPVTLTGTDYACIVTHDRAAGKSRFWINSRTPIEYTHNFQPAGGSSFPGTIGARATFDTEFMAANTRLYSFGLLNASIDSTQAGIIYDLLNARHNRVYA